MDESTEEVSEPLLEVRELRVSFGPVRVLHGVNLRLWAGEVHGLLGANGSGKSTIIKVLAGFHSPEADAQLLIGGIARPFPRDANAIRACRMSFVHQDLGLANDLTVLENLRASSVTVFPRSRWRISWELEAEAAREMTQRFGIELPLHKLVRDITLTERAALAICRAVWDAQGGDTPRNEALGSIIILDEPTTSLPRDQIDHLRRTLRSIAEHGNAVLIVTHDLEEAIAMTDHITVLRNGEVSSEMSTRNATVDALVEAIVGQRIQQARLRADGAINSTDEKEAAALQVRALSGRWVRDVSFQVRSGEVVGLAGLPGSGFEEVIPLVYGIGASEDPGGIVTVGGSERLAREVDPALAVVNGFAFLPADRQVAGSCQELSMQDNVVMPVIRRFFRRGRLHWSAVSTTVGGLLRDFQVRPPRPKMRFGSFSGGNQQKALLARCLTTRPRLLLLEEPTQGVDVGARYQIQSMIRDAARGGTAVLCASTDYEQLAELCDRVLLFRRGTIAVNLSGRQVTKEVITAAAHQPAVDTSS